MNHTTVPRLNFEAPKNNKLASVRKILKQYYGNNLISKLVSQFNVSEPLIKEIIKSKKVSGKIRVLNKLNKLCPVGTQCSGRKLRKYTRMLSRAIREINRAVKVEVQRKDIYACVYSLRGSMIGLPETEVGKLVIESLKRDKRSLMGMTQAGFVQKFGNVKNFNETLRKKIKAYKELAKNKILAKKILGNNEQAYPRKLNQNKEELKTYFATSIKRLNSVEKSLLQSHLTPILGHYTSCGHKVATIVTKFPKLIAEVSVFKKLVKIVQAINIQKEVVRKHFKSYLKKVSRRNSNLLYKNNVDQIVDTYMDKFTKSNLDALKTLNVSGIMSCDVSSLFDSSIIQMERKIQKILKELTKGNISKVYSKGSFRKGTDGRFFILNKNAFPNVGQWKNDRYVSPLQNSHLSGYQTRERIEIFNIKRELTQLGVSSQILDKLVSAKLKLASAKREPALSGSKLLSILSPILVNMQAVKKLIVQKNDMFKQHPELAESFENNTLQNILASGLHLNDIKDFLIDQIQELNNFLKNSPKIKNIKVTNDSINITGGNLPHNALTIKLDSIRMDLQRDIKAGVTEVKIIPNANIGSLIRHAIETSYPKLPKIPSSQLLKIQAQIVKRYSPTIVVWGMASMEGSFASNKRIALARAKSAIAQLKKQYPSAHFKAEWAIQGVDGEKLITQKALKEAEEAMVEKWNNKFNDKKVKSVKEIYAKLKASNLPPKQAKFIKTNFLNARKVEMRIEKSKKTTAPATRA